MEVAGGIKGSEDTVVYRVPCSVVALNGQIRCTTGKSTYHMVGDDVDHHVHATCVQSVGQIFEILSSSVVVIDLVASWISRIAD